MVIEPIPGSGLRPARGQAFEVQFRKASYGFRPGRGCKDALREVDRLLKDGYTHVVDVDLKGDFDTIPHDRLMALVEGSINAFFAGAGLFTMHTAHAAARHSR